MKESEAGNFLHSQCFARIERITKRREFERVFKIGVRKKIGTLTLIYSPSDTRRIGIILDRHIKGAVVRNKLKRRLRDIYRKNKSCFKGECIIIAYKGTEVMDYNVLRDAVLKLLTKQGV
ncbi:MAG: ribonuclease P protein component [Candidatus Stahlbacteria bacterium]|nr:ribonuclease P protein component [Candidatus Stahlbacteria bacterium]